MRPRIYPLRPGLFGGVAEARGGTRPGDFVDRSQVGWMMGLEPTTAGTTTQSSNQLSYIHRAAPGRARRRASPKPYRKSRTPASGPRLALAASERFAKRPFGMTDLGAAGPSANVP